MLYHRMGLISVLETSNGAPILFAFNEMLMADDTLHRISESIGCSVDAVWIACTKPFVQSCALMQEPEPTADAKVGALVMPQPRLAEWGISVRE